MAIANVTYVNIRPNNRRPEVTEICLGFTIAGEDQQHYINIPVAGGSEGQQKFAYMAMRQLLTEGGPYEVELVTNERGYTDVQLPRRERVQPA